MITFIDPKLGVLKTENNACCSKTGNLIYDKKKHRVGKIIKEGQSGNYNLIYIDFNDGSKLLKVNPLDDAQRKGRFYKVI